MEHSGIRDFREGLRGGIPIALGYFAVAIVVGLSGKSMGMSVFETAVMSFSSLTSTGEFAMLKAMEAGTSLLDVALAEAVINMRYLLMSCSLSQKIDPKLGTMPRLLMAYSVTDEIFGVSVARKGTLSPLFFFGLTVLPVIGWTGGTVTGALAGAVLSPRLTSVLSLSLYGMFISVVLPPARRSPVLAGVVAFSALASWGAGHLLLLSGLSESVRLVLVIVAVSAIAALICPVKESPDPLPKPGDQPSSSKLTEAAHA